MMFTPYLVATDPELIKQIFTQDFEKFRNNDFIVSVRVHSVREDDITTYLLTGQPHKRPNNFTQSILDER